MAESYETLYEDRYGNVVQAIFDSPLIPTAEGAQLPPDERGDEHFVPRTILGHRCVKSVTRPIRFTVQTTLGTVEQTREEQRFVLPKDSKNNDITIRMQRA